MATFNPYDILIRPVGPLTSEKVFDMQEKLDAGTVKAYRKASREALKAAVEEATSGEALTAKQKAKAKKKAERKQLHSRGIMRRDLNRNQNKVVFLVRDNATKPQIKHAIELVYNVKVVKVNTLHTKRGKRAIIKLSENDPAQEVYNRLGQM